MVQLGVLSWFTLDFLIAFCAAVGAFVLSPYDSAVSYDSGFLSLKFSLHAFLFGSITAILANILGLHELGSNIRFSSLINRCLVVSVSTVVLVSVLILFTQFEILGRYVMIFAVILISAGLVGSRILRRLLLTSNKTLITFMGSRLFETKAIKDIKTDIWLSYNFEPTQIKGLPQTAIEEIIDTGVSEIVINTHDLEMISPADLLEYVENGIRVTSYTSFVEHNKQFIPIDEIDSKWIINAQLDRAHPYYNSCKRLFDLIVSIIGLVVTLPLFLVLILLVRLDSRGGAIYSQVRVGQFGKPFRMYKIRSMSDDAEQNGAQWAQVDDERITRIGSILRKTRLDEIPQLWNVLVGDMSLVGPRPERPEFVDLLEQEITFFSQRHLVKPGITGWAQVKYQYGADVEDAKHKLGYDLFYIKNLSLALDFRILLRTVGTLTAGSR